jgi:hypothetical protein
MVQCDRSRTLGPVCKDLGLAQKYLLGGDHILHMKPQGFTLLLPIGFRIFGERD